MPSNTTSMDELSTNQEAGQQQIPVSKPEEPAASTQAPTPETQSPPAAPPDIASQPISAPEFPAPPTTTAPADVLPPAVSAEALANQDFRVRQKEAKKAKKEKRLQKLLEFIRQEGSASNDDIQKVLYVSDATASRYTKELVQRGLIKKIGKTKDARYQIN